MNPYPGIFTKKSHLVNGVRPKNFNVSSSDSRMPTMVVNVVNEVAAASSVSVGSDLLHLDAVAADDVIVRLLRFLRFLFVRLGVLLDDVGQVKQVVVVELVDVDVATRADDLEATLRSRRCDALLRLLGHLRRSGSGNWMLVL